MTIETSSVADSLFACESEDFRWHNTEHDLIQQIDQTLDLIAQATSPALAARAEYEVTIIVPVFNERETLPKVLQRIDEVMPSSIEVIVVDDGSTDGTAEWLSELPPQPARSILLRRRNHGKGSAVRLAIRHSRGKIVAIQDADLEYDPADLWRVIWPIADGEADVVYGSRYLRESDDPSLVHRLGNRLLTYGSNTLTGLDLTDMETCHKAFDGELLRSIPLRETRFGFESEITAKVANRGAQVLEVHTRYDGRGYQQGKKITWKDAVSTLACIWKYRAG